MAAAGTYQMAEKNSLVLEVELPEGKPDRSADSRDVQAMALAEAVITQVLPRLAAAAGVEKHRVAGTLLVELGYVVGLSHAPAAAVDALAVATERMRDALAGKRQKAHGLPMPTVAAPRMLQ
jgi:hypothetical protein